MILSYRKEDYTVPWSSKCTIQKTKEVSDGDTVTITSPVFSSIDFLSGAVNTSETFNVPIHLEHSGTETVSIGQSVTLICPDDDTFNMYVTL